MFILFRLVTYEINSSAIYGAIFIRNNTIHIPKILIHFIFQTVISLIDVPVSSRPWRYSHVYISFIYGFLYIAFQLIYILVLNGEDASGNPWIYPILDWKNDPGKAVGWVVLVMVILVFAHGFLCLLAFSRDWVWKKWFCNNEKELHSLDVENVTHYNSTRQ